MTETKEITVTAVNLEQEIIVLENGDIWPIIAAFDEDGENIIGAENVAEVALSCVAGSETLGFASIDLSFFETVSTH